MASVLGFIGSGNIATAMVKGLCRSDKPPKDIRVSDKIYKKAKALADSFSQVSALENNQAVIDASDCVFICVLPQIAPEVLKALRFREEQTVVTVVAIRTLAEISTYVSPAKTVVRAVPLPPLARHLGPVVFYPNVPEVAEIFVKIGTIVPVHSERELIVLSGLTGLIAPYYQLLTTFCNWAVDAGVEADMASRYVVSMFLAQTQLALDAKETDLAELAAEAATPGGINEQALREITEKGAYDVFVQALDAILLRLGEKPTKKL
jgi:pyrroline-5-carboxylate reductase